METLIQISSKYGHGVDRLTGQIVKIDNFIGRFVVCNENSVVGQVRIYQSPEGRKLVYINDASRPVYITEVDEHVGGIGSGIWLSTIVLSSWITGNKHMFNNKRVLELGCGVGLCGLSVVMETYPRSFHFTDCDKTLFKCLKQNIEDNSPNMRIIPSVMHFDWDQCKDMKCATSSYDIAQGGYDVIIAADCMFHNTKCTLLKAILCNLNVNGTLIMANPPEWNRPGFDEFIYALQEHGEVLIERCQLTMNKQYSKEIWVVVLKRTTIHIGYGNNVQYK